MTRYTIRIEELVLHDVPPQFADGLGPLLSRRLAEPPSAPPAGQVRTGEDLADRIAHAVWQQIGADGGEPR